MFKLPPLPAHPPTTADEALQQARALLQQAGLEDAGAKVELEHNAATPTPTALRGAALRASIPVTALERAAFQAAQSELATHGLTLNSLRLALENTAPNQLAATCDLELKVFGSSFPVHLEGQMDASEQTHMHFKRMRMDAGRGMLSGMATAMLLPRLQTLEANPLELARLAKMPARLTALHVQDGLLHATLGFE